MSKPNFLPKGIRNRTKSKVSSRKEVIKIRVDINKIETKTKTKQKRPMKLRAGSFEKIKKI